MGDDSMCYLRMVGFSACSGISAVWIAIMGRIGDNSWRIFALARYTLPILIGKSLITR